MKEEKNPVDILDEIMNRSGEEPRPSSCPPKFDPPLPEEEPPPPEKKAPLSQRLIPWLCGLLAGAVMVGVLCGVELAALHGRLDELGAAMGEIQTVDDLRKENERLQNHSEGLQEQLDKIYDEAHKYTLEASIREQQAGWRLRQNEYLYYMERFLLDDDLPMAALVMNLEDFVLRPPVSGSDPVSVPLGEPDGRVSLSSVQQERYDEVRRVLEQEGVLYSSGLTQKNGTAPLWPSGTGPSEAYHMAALGILWSALDAHFVQGNDQAAAQYLYHYFEDDLMGYRERAEGLAGDFALRQYQTMIDELAESQWLTVGADGRMDLGCGPTGASVDILYSLPFDPPQPGSFVPD